MRTTLLTPAVLLLSLTLCACATPPNQERTGMVIGGILGGALGSQIGGGQGRTAATVVGTLFGAAVGGSVGRSMDEQDRLKVAHTLETVRTGVSTQWQNPDTGNAYSVVPTRTYETAGHPCREYTVNGTIGGRHEKIYGTACRQPDGSWRAAN
ncbi:MAG: glycine zipper 2TM domain-containing protein [Burkholderiales bacterium]|nr:glycine zipper 2TM domain-containing protein [Burkholderiales bacterium]